MPPPLPATRVCSPIPGLLSEGPRWDAEKAELIWVDILAGELYVAPLDDHGNLKPVRSFRAARHVGAAAPATTADTCSPPLPGSATSPMTGC